MRRIGFTGTREGMTRHQELTLISFLAHHEHAILHHGDCIGADVQAHHIALALALDVEVHPPSDPKHRAFSLPQEDPRVHPPKPYLARDRDIVVASDILVATPKQSKWSQKGGTWYTVNYAFENDIPIRIIWPDGTVKREP